VATAAQADRRSVLIVDPDAAAYRARLGAAFPGLDLTAVPLRTAIPAGTVEAEAIIGFASALDGDLLARAPRLAWIQSLATGTDRITTLPGLRPEVIVTSARGIHGAPVSELAFLHLLMLARAAPRMLANQAAGRWQPIRRPMLAGRTAVILGTGTIGAALAARCRAFGMAVHGVTASPRALSAFDAVHPRTALAEAAALADFLIVLVPLSAATERLIDARILAAMKPTAYLINLTRGGVCDQEALLAALRDGRIAGAGLDVAEPEPLPPDHPLWREGRAIVTPHVAGYVDGYRDLVMPILEHNLRCFMERRWDAMMNRVARD